MVNWCRGTPRWSTSGKLHRRWKIRIFTKNGFLCSGDGYNSLWMFVCHLSDCPWVVAGVVVYHVGWLETLVFGFRVRWWRWFRLWLDWDMASTVRCRNEGFEIEMVYRKSICLIMQQMAEREIMNEWTQTKTGNDLSWDPLFIQWLSESLHEWKWIELDNRSAQRSHGQIN